MKKLFLLLAIVTSLALVGCGKKEDSNVTTTGSNSNTGSTDEQTNDFWDKDHNGTPDWQEEQITLKYATWQYTDPTLVTIDSLLVEAFQEKYPNITVEMDIVGEWTEWDTNMLARVETNDLPDVFLIQRAPLFLDSQILYDMTDLYDNDPDTQYIFDSVKNVGVYNDKRYALPTFIYPNYWVVNLDLLNEKGIPAPSYDWTYDQFESIAKATTDETKHYFGIHGGGFYLSEYPAILNASENWQAYTYDGTKFNFNSPSFTQAFNKQLDAYQQGYLTEGLSTDEKELYYGDPDFNPMIGGKVAMWQIPSYAIKDEYDSYDFEWDVYPGPNGITGGGIDLAGIASTTEHPEAAYQLLKWMSFGEDGLLERYSLFDTELAKQGLTYNYPIVDYGVNAEGVNEVWSNIPYSDMQPGMVSDDFINGLRHMALWNNKAVIGWDDVSTAVDPYFQQVRNGESDLASLIETIQEAADQAQQDAQDSIFLE